MDGKDLQRSIGPRLAGKATRASIDALTRAQAPVAPGSADEIARARRVAEPGPEDRTEASRRIERAHR